MIMITCLGMSFTQTFTFLPVNYTNYYASISASFQVQPFGIFSFI